MWISPATGVWFDVRFETECTRARAPASPCDIVRAPRGTEHIAWRLKRWLRGTEEADAMEREEHGGTLWRKKRETEEEDRRKGEAKGGLANRSGLGRTTFGDGSTVYST